MLAQIVGIVQLLPVILTKYFSSVLSVRQVNTSSICPSLQAIRPLDGSLCHCFDRQTGHLRRGAIPARDSITLLSTAMKFFFIVALFVLIAAAWTDQDYEIFDLVTAIEASEGKGTTFYSWLDVSPTASTNEIARAYRKLSMQLQCVLTPLISFHSANSRSSPDKNPKDKKIHERFARLGVVSTILRNAESRERFVH